MMSDHVKSTMGLTEDQVISIQPLPLHYNCPTIKDDGKGILKIYRMPRQ